MYLLSGNHLKAWAYYALAMIAKKETVLSKLLLSEANMAIDRRRIGTIIRELRAVATDTQDIEVKESVQRLPTSMAETVSAFSNGPGGTIILGLSEKNGFVAAPGFRAKPTADALATICSDKLTPPIRPEIDVVDFENAQLVVAHVHELPPCEKPCYVTDRGVYHGSFVRVSDGDRKLTTYEVDRLLEERAQPTFDLDIVSEATLTDLDRSLVSMVLERQRTLHPTIFANRSDTEVLIMLRALVRDDDGALHPTIAGLLALGTYPQQFFPRLTVAFTAHAKRDGTTGLISYEDAETMAGPIPAILADTVAAVKRSSEEEGSWLPIAAVREAVANALVHRDYSPLARGTVTRVSLSANQLVVTSPGGLYGTVTTESLGTPGYSSARNQFLLTLLESVPFSDGYLVKNRKEGYRIICDELAEAGLPAPKAEDHISSFELTISRPTEPTPQHDTSDQIVMLLLEEGEMTSAELADATGLTRRTVTNRLARLMTQGVVQRIGKPRSPQQRYRLS